MSRTPHGPLHGRDYVPGVRQRGRINPIARTGYDRISCLLFAPKVVQVLSPKACNIQLNRLQVVVMTSSPRQKTARDAHFRYPSPIGAVKFSETETTTGSYAVWAEPFLRHREQFPSGSSYALVRHTVRTTEMHSARPDESFGWVIEYAVSEICTCDDKPKMHYSNAVCIAVCKAVFLDKTERACSQLRPTSNRQRTYHFQLIRSPVYQPKAVSVTHLMHFSLLSTRGTGVQIESTRLSTTPVIGSNKQELGKGYNHAPYGQGNPHESPNGWRKHLTAALHAETGREGDLREHTSSRRRRYLLRTSIGSGYSYLTRQDAHECGG
ncbi:hypothetical protein POSPLADRAFT_1142331 [Postia placenta MAD-698-R-SB12]|uniref:Uncharacterized protein n=1 Tax=Postia placenta MAD-698-R-SB12 TaxID=670580 RepID=A0A1X6N1H2_9APHY|nr:hypothetical protein POSPLADRAFT_1142331 [Postia placenta MAD-698-R-SB12]OSX62322.1 hypothetical protein POSPLADRAFT_1142331 [Postia placenta MAD-698-R-SB12]